MSKNAAAAAIGCQEFAQNAWKKDLCSNCYKPRADHDNVNVKKGEINNDKSFEPDDTPRPCPPPPPPPCPCKPAQLLKDPIYECHLNRVISSKNVINNSNINNNVIINNNNIKNNNNNNNVVKNWTKKIGSNGAMLWEVGHQPLGLGLNEIVDKQKKKTNGDDNEPKTSPTSGGHDLDKDGGQSSTIVLNGVVTHDSSSSSSNGIKVSKSILRDRNKSTSVAVVQNGVDQDAAASYSGRRGSVEFLEASPKVIGYGGRDYDDDDDDEEQEDDDDDWDKDQSSSDLDDSLDSLQLSAEEKAFTQLTDQNTEFNADNSNLLTVGIAEQKKSTATSTAPPPVQVVKLSSLSNFNQEVGLNINNSSHHQQVAKSLSELYSMPKKSMAKLQQSSPQINVEEEEEKETVRAVSASSASPPPPPPPPPLSPPPTSLYAASSSANAQKFIRSNLYSTSPASASDTEDFLDAEEFPGAETSTNAMATMDDHLKDDHAEGRQRPSSKTGSTTLKVGFQSVPVRLPASTQRASVQDLFKEEPVTAAERRAAFKQSLPIPTKVLQNGINKPTTTTASCSPYGVVAVSTSSRQQLTQAEVAPPQIPSRPPPDSDDESQRLPLQSNRSKVNNGHVGQPNRSATSPSSVNHSCHYASSYVTTSKPEMTRVSDCTKPPESPTKSTPPAIKPKPKLPTKPSVATLRSIQGQSFNANDDDDDERKSSSKRPTSVLYQEIDENPTAAMETSMEVIARSHRYSNLKTSQSVDVSSSSRRLPKRRAPKPPKELPKASSKDASANEEDDEEGSKNRKMSTASLSSIKVDSPPGTGSTMPTTTTTTTTGKMKFATSRSYTLNSSSRTSSSSLESYCSKTPPMQRTIDTDRGAADASGHQINTLTASSSPSSTKDSKLKKNRFSLKKLLKFGSRDASLDSEIAKSSKGERRERLEILHPIDLMQNKNGGGAADDVNTSYSTTSHEKKSAEVTSSNKDQSPKDKPPPPRRFRSQDVQDEPIKEKPARPPPPTTAKQTYRKNTKSSFADFEKSSPTSRNHVNGDRVHSDAEKRNSIYDSGMDYANLGDVRNSVAPKKPGRCTSSMTDISIDSTDIVDYHRNQMSASHISLQNYSYGGQQPDNEAATYYSPTNEESLPTEDDDDDADLYADQAGVTSTAMQDCENQSQSSSSFTSEVLSAIVNRSSDSDGGHHQTQTMVEQPPPRKVYEVVVVKGRNLEKIYSKSPVVSSDQTTMDCFRPAATSSPVDEECSATGYVGDGSLMPPAPSSSSTSADVTANWQRKKFSRLSLRKAKSVVHKSLEDNYGAVVSANHQTLTQILDQVSQCQHANASKLKQLEDGALRWSDFALLEDSRVTVVGKMAFYSAVWKQNLDVTLMVSPEPLNATIHSGRNPCVLMPAAEFEDDIPKDYVFDGDRSSSAIESTSSTMIDRRRRATVWVVERMRVETLTGVAEYLHLLSESDIESYERESCFVLLQLINGLKHLQVQGTEEVDGKMDDFLLATKSKDTNYRFLILPTQTGSANNNNNNNDATASAADQRQYNDNCSNYSLSLCQCALKTMLMFLCAPESMTLATTEVDASVSSELRLDQLEFISTKAAFRLIGDILMQERATSLSQAKLLLEYMIWGPTDQLTAESAAEAAVSIEDGAAGGHQAVEKSYQRWLDLERATVLNDLIRTQSLWQIRLTVFEEYMLSFLVRTCAKTLREAAAQLQIAANSQ